MGSVDQPPDDDYLFTGEGEPDPDVARLEVALAPLKYRPRPLLAAPGDRVHNAPISPPAPAKVAPVRAIGRRWPIVAGAVAMAAAFALIVTRDPDRVMINAKAFAVTPLEGSPRVGATPLDAAGRLPVGAWLETDRSSSARVVVADIGEIQVARDSRLRLVATSPTEHRLELARGSIAAKVTAPPRLFVVDTPSATAVDLGCAYRLDVGPDGTSHLVVESGQVSLEGHGKTAWVPAGAVCDTRKGAGPGIPRAADAPSALATELQRFDFDGGGSGAALAALRAARPRDVLSVWHLFRRSTDPHVRAEARALMVGWRVVRGRATDAEIDRMLPEKVIWPDLITD